MKRYGNIYKFEFYNVINDVILPDFLYNSLIEASDGLNLSITEIQTSQNRTEIYLRHKRTYSSSSKHKYYMHNIAT